MRFNRNKKWYIEHLKSRIDYINSIENSHIRRIEFKQLLETIDVVERTPSKDIYE